MEFSGQECCSGLPLPSPGHFPDSGIELSPPALAGGFSPAEPPGKPLSSQWPSARVVRMPTETQPTSVG